MLPFILSLAALAPQVIVREPRPATPWIEAFTARCGKSELKIERSIRPLGLLPRILMNGKLIRGDSHQVERELSEIRAAYRFSFLCSQVGNDIQLRWVRGVADGGGNVSFRSGSASIRDGVMVSSTFEEASEESFWYR